MLFLLVKRLRDELCPLRHDLTLHVREVVVYPSEAQWWKIVIIPICHYASNVYMFV